MDGLYTNTEMVDQIIIKLDGMMKALIGGERLAFAAGYVEIMQMLASLKKGIDTDNRMHAQQVKMLEEQLAAANTITDRGRRRNCRRRADRLQRRPARRNGPGEGGHLYDPD